MADLLGWGQPMGTIAQLAYVVEDLATAIDHCIRDGGAGPFFVLDRFWQPGQIYRGNASKADMAIAMGFAGNTWIELIQPLDDHPSIYREAIAERGYGLHHHGIPFRDVEAAVRSYSGRGWREVFRAAVPTGGEVVFLEGGHAAAPAFLELLPVTPGMDAHFTGFWKAAQGWDGSEPVRPFI